MRNFTYHQIIIVSVKPGRYFTINPYIMDHTTYQVSLSQVFAHCGSGHNYENLHCLVGYLLIQRTRPCSVCIHLGALEALLHMALLEGCYSHKFPHPRYGWSQRANRLLAIDTLYPVQFRIQPDPLAALSWINLDHSEIITNWIIRFHRINIKRYSLNWHTAADKKYNQK